MRYYLVAGERSGDLHAGNLVKALKREDPGASFRGFGGEYMQQAGVELAVHYGDMAFMGLAEIITNAGKIKKFIRLCKEDIQSYKPDVIILIDYGGFNLQIARFGKKNGFRIYYYIPPKYWAWYPKRAEWLKPYVDHLFIILPFEKEFFKNYKWEAHYVGNPVLDAVNEHLKQGDDHLKHHEQDVVALLPGSRKQELKRIIPLMVKIVRKFPEQRFAVAAVSNLDSSWYRELNDLKNVEMVFEDTYNLLMRSTAAIVTSGTATLETALFNVPQVVVYKANALSYWLAKGLIKVKFISLVNLIACREVVKEMIQSNASPVNVADELRRLISDKAYRSKMQDEFRQIRETLDTGSASDNAARLMVEFLNGKVSKNRSVTEKVSRN